VKDQVYDGSMREDFRASRLVERTRGLVLTVGSASKPAPIKAFYHSTCGGRTELPEKVWGSKFPGFQRTVPCPFCASSPALRWNAQLDAKQISTGLLRGAENDGPQAGWPKDWKRMLSGGKLVDLRVASVDPTGRVERMQMLWSQGP